MSVDAYRRTKTIAASARETEHRLMSEITGQMIGARDAGLTGSALTPALHRNREAWSLFSALCSSNENKLPDEIRAGIISLALWVDRFTTEVITGRDSIDALIEVNRTIIAGLANQAQANAA